MTMKITGFLISAAALAIATPAMADATYTGKIKGIITSGGETIYPVATPGYIFNDFTGQTVDITFRATVYDGKYNFYGDYQLGYTELTALAITSTGYGISVNSSNDEVYANIIQGASFVGNKVAGNVSGFENGAFLNNSFYSFALAFSQNGRAGSGSVRQDLPGFTYDDYYTAYNFDVVSGYVTGPSVPEPATWSLMIVGFGLVGAGLRRKNTATVTYA